MQVRTTKQASKQNNKPE